MLKSTFKIILFVISFLFSINNLSANTCDYVEMARLKSVASNLDITYTYTYNADLDDVKFKINIENIKENIIIKDVAKGTMYTFNGNTNLELSGYDDNKKYQFDIYTDTTECSNKTLLTRYIYLPKYNQYYNDDVCGSVSDYYMCQMWYQHELSKEEFYSKLNEYKKTLNIDNEEVPKETDVVSSIIDLIIDNYYFFVGFGVILILVRLIYVIKENKDTFDLRT